MQSIHKEVSPPRGLWKRMMLKAKYWRLMKTLMLEEIEQRTRGGRKDEITDVPIGVKCELGRCDRQGG